MARILKSVGSTTSTSGRFRPGGFQAASLNKADGLNRWGGDDSAQPLTDLNVGRDVPSTVDKSRAAYYVWILHGFM